MNKTARSLNTSKIRELMNLEEISQKDLAGKIGVAPSTLSDWLSGKTTPTKQHITQIAEILDTDAESLTTEHPSISIGAHSVVYNIFYATTYNIAEGANVTLNVNNAPPDLKAHAANPDEDTETQAAVSSTNQSKS